MSLCWTPSNFSWRVSRILDFDHRLRRRLAFSLTIWRKGFSRVIIFVNPLWVGKLQNDHVRHRRQALASIEFKVRVLSTKPFWRMRVEVSGVTTLSRRLMNALLESITWPLNRDSIKAKAQGHLPKSSSPGSSCQRRYSESYQSRCQTSQLFQNPLFKETHLK